MSLEGFSHRKNEYVLGALENDTIEKKTYTLESGVTVDLIAKEFSAEKIEKKKERAAVIFLPGWSMTAEDESIGELCHAYAKNAGEPTIAISSRSKEQGVMHVPEKSDFLFEEARAIAKYIEERGIENVTIVGHSQGGDKAIDVASILQGKEGTVIHGLILLGSAGLYRQSPDSMEKLNAHLSSLGKENEANVVRSRREGALTDIQKNVFWEMMRSLFNYPQRVASQVEEVNKKNPHMKELTMPVVIISGADDPVSAPKKIVPIRSEIRLRKDLGEESGKSDMTLAAREQFLKQVFKRSPRVRLLVGGRTSGHLLPIEQPEQVAEISLYTLERFQRGDTLH